MTTTPPPEGTEPRECLDDAEATVLDGWCAHVGFRHVGPCPPAPAAEDDAVEKAARVWHAEDATEPRAWDALSDDERGWYIATTRKSLAAAGVSALWAEVAEWRRVAAEQTRMERDRAEAAEAEVERLRERVGEVEEDRDDWVQVAGERAGQRDEARQQVAALRAGIEALPHLTVNTDGGRMTVVRVDDLNRALVAEGGQPDDRSREETRAEARKALAALADPDVQAGIAGVLRDAYARTTCGGDPTAAGEVSDWLPEAAAVVEWLRGERQ